VLTSILLTAVSFFATAEKDWYCQPGAFPARLSQAAPDRIALENGLVRRSFLLAPNAATVGLDSLARDESLLRAVRPEARIVVDGVTLEIGGLTGQPIENYLAEEWLGKLTGVSGAFQFTRFEQGPIEPRFAWKPRNEWLASTPVWPPRGVHLVLHFESADPKWRGLGVAVHHEIYDGIPLLAKWLTLENGTQRSLRIDSFTSEILALVENGPEVEPDSDPELPNVHVETDSTVCSMSGASSQVGTVRWLADPRYETQVNYERKTPCLLECTPRSGPGIDLVPGARFDSFRTFLLTFDSDDADRRSLSLQRMYRTIAPWVAENPLIFHCLSNDPERIRGAIDQAAEVGFELVILSFGSGFDIENDSPEYIARFRDLVAYAHSKGIALGGYSLLASRSVDAANDVVNPETGKPGGFARFGNSPCLCSEWGERYFAKLERFFTETGFDALEHDGSYPGDECAATVHPGHRDLADSYWRQRERITSFYRWCRGRGIYLNVPDWYFLNGSSKTGMGYRETNWSLPRELQEVIERQNIADGVRFKTPTMGWMFVPLTQYHGGGAAATIEPLAEHLDHYERRLWNLLGAGVQACFRGPRLFDSEATRDTVKRVVAFYQANRVILDSDLVVLRRPDGRDYDGWLHVRPAAPAGEDCGLAMFYNPLTRVLDREVALPVGLTGVTGRASIAIDDRAFEERELDSDAECTIKLSIPPLGHSIVRVRRPHPEVR
jgi:hypothetical protein